jgi:hypothetical protein
VQRAEITGLSEQAWAAFSVRRDYLPDAMENLIALTYKVCNGRGNLRLWDQTEAHDILQSHIFITVGDTLERSHARKAKGIQGEDRWHFLEGTAISIITTKLPRLLAGEAPINLTDNPNPDGLCGVSRNGLGSRQYASLGVAVADERFLYGSHSISPELAMLDQEEEMEEFETRKFLVEYIRPLITVEQYQVMRMHIVEAMPASFMAKQVNRTAHSIRCIMRRACNSILEALANGELPVTSIDLTPLFSTDPRLHERLKHFLQVHPEHTDKFRPQTSKPLPASKPAKKAPEAKPAKAGTKSTREYSARPKAHAPWRETERLLEEMA